MTGWPARLWARIRARWGVDDGPAPGEGHDHGLPSLKAVLVVVVVFLVAAVAIVYVGLSERITDLEIYVGEARVYRDAEADRFADALCDVLDRLPPDPTLTELRADYGCGPGITIPIPPEDAP